MKNFNLHYLLSRLFFTSRLCSLKIENKHYPSHIKYISTYLLNTPIIDLLSKEVIFYKWWSHPDASLLPSLWPILLNSGCSTFLWVNKQLLLLVSSLTVAQDSYITSGILHMCWSHGSVLGPFRTGLSTPIWCFGLLWLVVQKMRAKTRTKQSCF